MKNLMFTFVLLSLAQIITGELTPINLPLIQGQKADAQAAEKQAEAERLSSEVIRLFGERKFDEALPLANRVLELSEVAFGPGDAAVANAASNLAELYYAKGSPQKAEPFLLRAIEINDKVRKPADPVLVKTLERYTCVLKIRKQDDKLKEFEKARRPTLNRSAEPDRFWGLVWGVAEIISIPRPVYPQAATDERTSQSILVEVTVDEQGKVIRAQSMCGGSAMLIKVSEEAAKKAQFKPVLVAGVPTRIIGYLCFKFVGQQIWYDGMPNKT
jgi:tetratricopeptide (TPR) repeat protein